QHLTNSLLQSKPRRISYGSHDRLSCRGDGSIACTVLGCLNEFREQEHFMVSRYFRLVGIALLLGAGFSVVVGGQSAPVTETRKVLTVEGSLNLRTVADLQFSVDGGRLAFVVTEPAKGTGRLRHLWIYYAGS